MKKEELRKVLVTKYPDGSGGYTIEGYFHRLGDKTVPQDNGLDLPRTVAIIERTDGVVIEVEPTRVKFVEHF